MGRDPNYPQWFEVKPLEVTRIDEVVGVFHNRFSLILVVKETLKHLNFLAQPDGWGFVKFDASDDFWHQICCAGGLQIL